MMALPKSTDSEDSRHPNLWTAAWWRTAPLIEIQAAQIVKDEDSRLRHGADEVDA